MNIKFNEPLANWTSLRIGGKVRALVTCDTDEELKRIVHYLGKNRIPLFMLGGGSNLVISDGVFDGCIIRLGKEFSFLRIIENRRGEMAILETGAGVNLKDLIRFTYRASLGGLEFLVSIPGTVGGAIKNNAGAFSHSIKERLLNLQGILISAEGEIRTMRFDSSDLDFRYRRTELPSGFIITKAQFELFSRPQEEIKKDLKRYIEQRRATQPKGASCGSIFLNPENHYAGKLLDLAGVKGLSVGGAYVSKKHANFIINDGSASFSDVYELIQIMKLRAEKKSGIILKEEVEIVPKNQGRVLYSKIKGGALWRGLKGLRRLI